MSTTPASDALVSEIAVLADKIRELKLAKEPFTDELARLKELRAQLPPPPPKTEQEIKEANEKSGKGKKAPKVPSTKLILKTPKVSAAPVPVAPSSELALTRPGQLDLTRLSGYQGLPPSRDDCPKAYLLHARVHLCHPRSGHHRHPRV